MAILSTCGITKSKFRSADKMSALREFKERVDPRDVLNPAKLPIGMPDQNYFPICRAMIDAADEVYMLKDWYDSQGACLEREYATARGKKVFVQEDQIF